MQNTLDAETFISIIRRASPSTCRTRILCLNNIFGAIGTGFYWVDGKVRCKPNSDKWDEIEAKVLNGTAESIEKYYLRNLRTWAERTVDESIRKYSPEERKNQIEATVKDFIQMDEDADKEPFVFSHISEHYSLICQIPDNVQHDWLACCYEYLDEMSNAKIDFAVENLETPEIEIPKNFAQMLQRARFMRSLFKELEADGTLKQSPSQTVRQRGIIRRRKLDEWAKLHSPEAKAFEANAVNKRARQIADKVFDELHAQCLYRQGPFTRFINNMKTADDATNALLRCGAT